MRNFRLHACLLAICLLIVQVLVHGDRQRVTLKGRMTATLVDMGEGRFTLVADDLDEPLTLLTTPDSYLHQYIEGSVGHRVVITIEPEL